VEKRFTSRSRVLVLSKGGRTTNMEAPSSRVGNVTLKGFRFSEKKFDVQFGFQSNRLVQVHHGDTISMEPNAAVRRAV
jgi:hypothetical protein